MEIEGGPLLQGKLMEMFRVSKASTTELVRVKAEPAELVEPYEGACAVLTPTLRRVKRELLSPSSCVTNVNSVVYDGVESAYAKSLKEQPALMTALLMIQRQEIKPEAVGASEKLITALGMLCGSSPNAAAVSAPMKLMNALHMHEQEPLAQWNLELEREPLAQLNFEIEQLKSASVPKSEPVAPVSELEQSKDNTQNSARDNTFQGGSFDCSTASEDEEDLHAQNQVGRSFQKSIKPRNTNPGRRIQGGRVYDSALGKTCHWCRQKTVEHHVKCRECTINYCGPCLSNRMGENILEELAEGVRWLCPKCRNGCGRGCDNCCNCGPCRKAFGKAPTGQMIAAARTAGFNNAHDYLVHLETGESAREIALRKMDRDWTNGGRFKWKQTLSTSESGDGTSICSDDLEFTLNEETSTLVHHGILDMKFVKKFVEVNMVHPAAASEAQKLKRDGTRAPLPAKRSRREDSTRAKRSRREDSTRAKRSQQELSSSVVDSVLKFNEKQIARRKAAEKYIDPKAKCTTQEIASVRSQDYGVRISACKREYDGGSKSDLDHSVLARKRKLDGDQRLVLLHEFLGSRPSLPIPTSAFKCKIEPIHFSQGVEDGIKGGFRQGVTVGNGSMECPSDPRGVDYRTKLKSALGQTFSASELELLSNLVRCRKPIQKLRQMRGRTVDVVTEDEGLSYLDHHQDFAAKLEEAQSPPVKLALLRGFFFWLQHSCMEGAFRPWPTSQPLLRHQHGDCVETEGPDCQVTAVVLQLDEGHEASYTHLQSTTTVQRQSLLPFQAMKKLVQHAKPKLKELQVSPAISYRVVLGLPAPALLKV